MTADVASMRPEELLQAFFTTHYRVATPGEATLTVRIGRAHPALDRLVGQQPWAIITACNPGAEPLDPSENQARHRRLCRRAGQGGWSTRPAVNRDPSGKWPDEPGLLLAGIDAAAAGELAREFGQVAFVSGHPDDNARLQLLGADWRGHLPVWARRLG